MKSVLQFLSGAVAFVLGQSGLLGLAPHSVTLVLTLVGTLLTALGIRSSSSVPGSVVDLLNGLGSGWKTIVGILVAAVGVLLSPDLANVIPPNIEHIITTIGSVLAALGLYHANAQSALKT